MRAKSMGLRKCSTSDASSKTVIGRPSAFARSTMTPHRGHRLGLTLPVKEARDEEARQVFELGGRNMHRGEDAADLLGTRRIKLRQQWRQAGINLHRREGGIVHVQNDTLGTVHKTNAVLRNLGNNGCGDRRGA